MAGCREVALGCRPPQLSTPEGGAERIVVAEEVVSEALDPHVLLAKKAQEDQHVEAAYGVSFNGDEERIVSHLFQLYAQKTS